MYVTDRASLRERYPSLAAYWDAHVNRLGDASRTLLARAGDTLRPFGWGDLNPINRVTKLAGAVQDDPIGTALDAVTPPVLGEAISVLGRWDAPRRFVAGGADALEDTAKSLVTLPGLALLGGADALRGSYEVLSGNRTGSTAARTRNPYARSVAASFEAAGDEARTALRTTPRTMATGVVQLGEDAVSGDPRRMGYALTSLALFGRSPAGLGGRAALAGEARLALRGVGPRLVRAPRATEAATAGAPAALGAKRPGVVLTDGMIVEGSSRFGGIQPDYLVDLHDPRLAPLFDYARGLRETPTLSRWRKVELVETRVASMLARRDYHDPVYRALLARYRRSGEPIPIGAYVEARAGVCRENAMLTHLALERAGVPSRFVYALAANGEDHAVVVVELGGRDFVVDTYYRGEWIDGMPLNRAFSELELRAVHRFPVLHPAR